MSYLLLKSLHICSVMVWIAGMVLHVVALQLRGARLHLVAETGVHTLHFFRRWDRIATAPAMLLTWVTGLSLAAHGGWFGNRWLFVKLAMVIVLSGMHGILAGRLRAQSQMERTELAEEPGPRPMAFQLTALFVIVAGILLLVVVKPF